MQINVLPLQKTVVPEMAEKEKENYVQGKGVKTQKVVKAVARRKMGKSQQKQLAAGNPRLKSIKSAHGFRPPSTTARSACLKIVANSSMSYAKINRSLMHFPNHLPSNSRVLNDPDLHLALDLPRARQMPKLPQDWR